MIASFPLETAIYTLAAIGVVAILREGWLWLLRRPGRQGALPVALTFGAPPAAEEVDYILGAAEEIRRYYFPGLTVRVGDGAQEKANAKGTGQN